MKRSRTTNPELIETIALLRKHGREGDSGLWKDVAKRLSKPQRNRAAVNLSRLNRHTSKRDSVVVPGKVLGTGRIDHPITVGALSFSQKAKQKIVAVNGKTLSLVQFAKKNPSGSNVKIIG